MALKKPLGVPSCAPLKSNNNQKKALSLRQQVALFYARKRRKARTSA